MAKVTKLPPANAYKYPYAGYKRGSNDFYKELRANKESWLRFRAKLLASQDYRCAYCETSLKGKRMNVEHILAIKHGGTNKIENLVAACAECNKEKGNSLIHRKLRPGIKTRALLLNKQAKEFERADRKYQQALGIWLAEIFRER